MAGREFTVTPAMLAEKADELKARNDKIKDKLIYLGDQERELDGMWDGPANDAFKREFGKKMAQMEEFVNSMYDYISALNRIAISYADAEKRSVNIAKG